MPLTNPGLYQKIRDFDFDNGKNVSQTFCDRLARENGWDRQFAAQVLLEYRRFVYLAMIEARPVTPSEEVDQAWHLHMVYSRSYWDRFCGQLLGKPLHHEPTEGGSDELSKHSRQYEFTKACYIREFDHVPPQSIWPRTKERFGPAVDAYRINPHEHWVIRKGNGRWLMLAAASAVITLIVGCGDLNPFALEGKKFFWVAGPAMVVAILVGMALRHWARGPGLSVADENRRLTWDEAAFLSGESARLFSATVARLVHRGSAKVVDDGTKVVAVGGAERLDPLEKALYLRLPLAKDPPTEMKSAAQAVELASAETLSRLQGDDLLPASGQRARARFVSVAPLLLVIVFLLIPRIVTGLANHLPTGYLIALTIVSLVAVSIMALSRKNRTNRRGTALLERERNRCTAMRTENGWTDPGSAALAVGLFGTTVLAGSLLAPLNTWYPRPATSGGTGCSSGCSAGGGGCGAGGGGGGGDGGGGGCGGCGGGGGGD